MFISTTCIFFFFSNTSLWLQCTVLHCWEINIPLIQKKKKIKHQYPQDASVLVIPQLHQNNELLNSLKFYFYSIWMKLLFKSSFDMIWQIQVQRKVWMQMNIGGTVFTKRSNCWNIIALRRKAHWICHPKVTSRHTGPHQSCFKHTHLNCRCATRTLLKYGTIVKRNNSCVSVIDNKSHSNQVFY